MDNVVYLSDRVQNCFMELFSTFYKENNDFLESAIEISGYLLSSNDKYCDILKKYDGVNKALLKQMIFSNFLEITYYRRKQGIKLDDIRLNILNLVEMEDLDDDSFMSLFYCDIHQFSIMVNDVLLYFSHPSPIYSFNVVKCISEEGFDKKLYSIYPLAVNEHMLTMEDSYSQKEFLLYTLIEIMINTMESLNFVIGEYPVPNPAYFQDIFNKLKEYDGSNPGLINLHKLILEQFNSRVVINKGNDYNKILLLEMLCSLVHTKHRCCILESEIEKQIMDKIHKVNFSLKDLSNLYDDNGEQIISSLINNWDMFPNEVILSDIRWFENVKEQAAKTLKRN